MTSNIWPEIYKNYWKENKPITIKTVRLVIDSESSDNEDDPETASEISDQELENPDLEPEGNSDVPYSEESSEILLKFLKKTCCPKNIYCCLLTIN